MKINQTTEANFPNGYQYYLHNYRNALYLVALISIILNTLVSPALGIKTVLIMVVAAISVRESEYIFYYHNKTFSREKTKESFGDTMTHLDGILLALFLPVGTPLFVVVIASVFANYIVKNGFGGFTYNIFNVAAVGAVFATLSWELTAVFTDTVTNNFIEYISGLPETITATFGNSVGLAETSYNFLLLGNTQIYLGYIPGIILVVLAAYLMYRKVISSVVVGTLVLSTIIFGAIINISLGVDNYVLNNLFIGSFMLATIFVATDPTVIPNTNYGRIFYGILIVFIMFVMRELGSLLDGVIFAILFANMLTPFINAKTEMMSSKKQLRAIIVVFALMLAGSFGIGNVASNMEPVENEVEYYEPFFVKGLTDNVFQGGDN
jgi:electron transport complex protein RnfD